MSAFLLPISFQTPASEAQVAALTCIGVTVYAIIRHPGWTSWLLLAVNLVVVWVLARDIGKRRPATAR